MNLLSTLCVARPQVTVSTKEECIYQCVAALVEGGWLRPEDLADAVQAVSRREQLGTTGIKSGFAMPHSRFPQVTSVVSAWFTLATPIDWSSLDGDPVRIVCCTLSPVDRPGDHLRFLEAVVRTIAGDDEFLPTLIRCQTEAEMRDLFASASPQW